MPSTARCSRAWSRASTASRSPGASRRASGSAPATTKAGGLKLPRPFFRLPVRFDAERLRAEVEALPTAAWSHHPQEYEGNTAVRLITVGGKQNDLVAGEMQIGRASCRERV